MYQFNLRELIPFIAQLPSAMLVTIELAGITIALSMVLGICLALVRQSKSTGLRTLGAFYVEMVRNMPLLVLVYIIYLGLPSLGWSPSGYVCAAIAITLNSAAFMTEIFRAGLISIPKGQYEAARSQGMNAWQVFRLVIFPQVVRVAFAPLGNQFIGVIMATSIASVVAVEELTAWMENTGAVTFRYFESFAVAAIAFLLLCQLTNLGFVIVDHYLFRQKGGRCP